MLKFQNAAFPLQGQGMMDAKNTSSQIYKYTFSFSSLLEINQMKGNSNAFSIQSFCTTLATLNHFSSSSFFCLLFKGNRRRRRNGPSFWNKTNPFSSLQRAENRHTALVMLFSPDLLFLSLLLPKKEAGAQGEAVKKESRGE